MFLGIWRGSTYINVALTIALVFAMSGGAYAASKYLITSTKQISPKILKQLTGKVGATGRAGTTGLLGPAGPAGPVGSTGPAGLAGVKGEPGLPGKAGVPGPKGDTGSPWPAGGTLPSGATETGVWGLSTHDEGGVRQTFSFPIPLVTALKLDNIHLIPPGEEGIVEPEACPGTLEKPAAAAGNLCMYTEILEAPLFGFAKPHASGVTGIFNAPTENKGGLGTSDEGTWAVTAE